MDDQIKRLMERVAEGDRCALAVLCDYFAERGIHPTETEILSVPLMAGSLGIDPIRYGKGYGWTLGDGSGGGYGEGDGQGSGGFSNGDGFGDGPDTVGLKDGDGTGEGHSTSLSSDPLYSIRTALSKYCSC